MNCFKLISEAISGESKPDWTKNPLLNGVADFLIDNPNPNDDQVHALAEEKGINPHKLESVFYFLATKAAQLLKQGRMNEKGITEDDVDPKQLTMGIKVEMEHSDCPRLAKKIALDHLAEIPDYYTRLDEKESSAGVKH